MDNRIEPTFNDKGAARVVYHAFGQAKAYQPIDLDCSANPYDLHTPAARIVHQIHVTKQRHPNAKIVVIMGEWHDEPLHHLLCAAVLEKAQNSGLKTLIGLEYDYNYYADLAHTLFKYNLQGEIIPFLQSQDKGSRHMLAGAFANAANLSYAPLSGAYLLHQIMRSGAHFVFGDLPLNKDFSLNTQDPLTKELCKQGATHAQADQPEGIAIRNKAYATITDIVVEEGQHDILIAQAGNIHVCGFEDEGYPHHQSLSKLYKDMGYQVISVLNTKPDCIFKNNSVPPTISIQGLSIGHEREHPLIEKYVLDDAIYHSKGLLQDVNLDKAMRGARSHFKKFIDASLKELDCVQRPWRRFLPF